MNAAALREYISFYSSKSSFRSAIDLFKKFPSPDAALSSSMTDLTVRYFLREGDGYAGILESAAAEPEGDRSMMDYYYEQSLRQYHSALKMKPSDRTVSERIELLKKKHAGLSGGREKK